MTKYKFIYHAAAAVMITIFATSAFSAVNPKDDGLKGKEVGTPIRVIKDGKLVWDICISPMPCGPGQIKIAKSAEQEACEANPKLCDLTRPLSSKLQMANLDPNAGMERQSHVAIGTNRAPRIELGCDSSQDANCHPEGQQMGGDPVKGQQMGPDYKGMKKLMKKMDHMVQKGLSW